RRRAMSSSSAADSRSDKRTAGHRWQTPVARVMLTPDKPSARRRGAGLAEGGQFMDLPVFKYHPDPIGTGSIVESDTECACCGRARGYVYAGPVYSEEEYNECICPWCISDGSAHEKLDASFTDEDGVGGNGDWDQVPAEVV